MAGLSHIRVPRGNQVCAVFEAVTLPNSSKRVVDTVHVSSDRIARSAVEARLEALYQGPVLVRWYLGLFKHLAESCVPILELLHNVVAFGPP